MASLFSTPDLIKAMAMLPPPDRFLVDFCFPTAHPSAKEEIAFDEIADDREIAAYVSSDVVAPAGAAKSQKLTSFKAPSVIVKEPLPVAVLTTRRPNEPFGQEWSPQMRQTDWIQEWSPKFRNRIVRRQLHQAAEVLVDGTVTVEGANHPPMTIDYDRHADLSVTLAGATAWGAAGVNPLNTLKVTAEAISDHGLGAVARTVIMDQKAWSLFSESDAVQKLLDKVRLPESGLVLDPQSNGRRYDDKGLIGDYRVIVYNDAYKLKDGTKVKFLPDNTAILIDPASFGGHRAFGMIPLVDEASGVYQPVTEEIVPDYIVTREPVGIFYRLQSRPLMVPVNVNASARITVA